LNGTVRRCDHSAVPVNSPVPLRIFVGINDSVSFNGIEPPIPGESANTAVAPALHGAWKFELAVAVGLWLRLDVAVGLPLTVALELGVWLTLDVALGVSLTLDVGVGVWLWLEVGVGV
jgi:hypothetical protein